MRHIYKGCYKFDISYKKIGLFKTLHLTTTCRWTGSVPVFAENEKDAEMMFMNSEYWILDLVEPWSWDTSGYISEYTVLTKTVTACRANYTLDYLKERMPSDMFLSYCRQELSDPEKVLMR